MRSAALLFSFLCAAGCTLHPLELCGEIPPGGCPIGRGGTCEDPECAGVYDCTEGSWVVLETCTTGGAGGAGGSGGDAGSGGASGGSAGAGGDSCQHAEIDHTGEVAGCTPALQDPDCPAAAAEALCIEDACATGCIDFFLCTKDGWIDVAYCDMEGTLVTVL